MITMVNGVNRRDEGIAQMRHPTMDGVFKQGPAQQARPEHENSHGHDQILLPADESGNGRVSRPGSLFQQPRVCAGSWCSKPASAPKERLCARAPAAIWRISFKSMGLDSTPDTDPDGATGRSISRPHPVTI